MGVAAERPLEATRDRLGARRGVLGVGLAAATVVLTLFAFGAVMLATLIAWPYVVGGLLVLAATAPPTAAACGPRRSSSGSSRRSSSGVAVRGLEGPGGAGGAPVGTPLPAAAHVAVPQAAIDHRPLLLFDRDEPFDRPLDVDGLLATGLVELCPGGEGLLADCRTVNGAGDLCNGFGNLRFDTKAVAGAVSRRACTSMP
jgi:hypothetical protein